MEEAIQSLWRDRFAQSTNRSRDSLLCTWCRLHAAAFAGRVPPLDPFPLTSEKLIATSALFKAGGYLSFDNYAFRAKSEHLMLGGESAQWTDHLRLIFNQCRDSVGRGSGVSRQSKPLHLIKAMALTVNDQPITIGGPSAPLDFAVAGCFFMLREIELTSALTKHVSISRDGLAATWLLPTSN